MSHKKTRHTSTYPGKRVELVMRDGTRVAGRFVEHHDRYIVLDTGRYMIRNVSSMLVKRGNGR